MSFYICYIGDKKMKVVQVQNTRYFIQDKDDLISVTHELARQGYSISQIAQVLGISERQVRKYLEDCW
ncbi:terminase small subunit [Sulfolobus islandicus rod-shaped virus 9]|uniref:Resolvase HTH domain-containing protein n=2 Tax=Usarudivirus TaxID=2843109 RepID=A0A1X9SJC7_9VIRU|nr:terminase small subunit [Sulfolobus islandicus rod-shaped virus 9]ARQ96355.1 hypothetical protein [Sulfolobus islandicus rod-shaped virus 9]